MFFSYNKLANNTFSHDFSASGLIWELKNLLASNFAAYVVVHKPRIS
jgi:hypothetical protein